MVKNRNRLQNILLIAGLSAWAPAIAQAQLQENMPELRGYENNSLTKEEKKQQENDPKTPVRQLWDNGQYVPPDGVIDGSNVKQFLNSGPVIDPTAMEEASIQADNMMQMPADVPSDKPRKKKTGFMGALSRGWVNTCNAIGFPVGKNDDIGVDASLSSDLPQEVRDAYGAYNPNK